MTSILNTNALAHATFASKGVTEPRHGIDDTVWIVTSTHEDGELPCPDCLGARTWTVTSPAGHEFELDCPRCSRNSGGFGGKAGGAHINQLPSLRYRRQVFSASSRSVVGIEIRQPPWSGDDPICYSFGGGSSAYEHSTFPSEEKARAAATASQLAEDAKKAAEPATLESGRFSGMTLRDAIITRQHDSLWDSWWVARHLLDELDGWLDEDKRPKSNDDIAYMFEDLGSTVKRLRAGKHYTDPGPFMGFVEWLQQQASGTLPIDPAVLSARFAEVREMLLPNEAA